MHLWRRKWQPSPVFLPGESHEQRSLAGYSSWSRKESDTTEWLTCTRTHILCTDYIWMYLYTTNRNALHVFKTVSHCKSELAKIFPLALDFRDLFNNYSTNSFPYLQSISLYKYLAIYYPLFIHSPLIDISAMSSQDVASLSIAARGSGSQNGMTWVQVLTSWLPVPWGSHLTSWASASSCDKWGRSSMRKGRKNKMDGWEALSTMSAWYNRYWYSESET